MLFLVRNVYDAYNKGMASFLENFREALGLGRANHIQHYSDISEKNKQKWANDFIENLKRSYDDENPSLRIHDTRAELLSDYDDKMGEFLKVSPGNTRIYEFSYDTPYSGKEGFDYGKPEKHLGRVLVRTPNYDEPRVGMFGRLPYFSPSLHGSFPSGDLGVYEAVLDNGQVLSAKDFDDLIRGNSYSRGTSPKFKEIKRTNTASVDEVNQLIDDLKNYRESLIDNDADIASPVYWDTKYRRWGRR